MNRLYIRCSENSRWAIYYSGICLSLSLEQIAPSKLAYKWACKQYELEWQNFMWPCLQLRSKVLSFFSRLTNYEVYYWWVVPHSLLTKPEKVCKNRQTLTRKINHLTKCLGPCFILRLPIGNKMVYSCAVA